MQLRTLILSLLLACPMARAAPAPFLRQREALPVPGTVFRWGCHVFRVTASDGKTATYEFAAAAPGGWRDIITLEYYRQVLRTHSQTEHDWARTPRERTRTP